MRRIGIAVVLCLAGAALAACEGMLEAERFPGRDDTRRPPWMPEPRERYPGTRLPDDGFRADLAFQAPAVVPAPHRAEA